MANPIYFSTQPLLPIQPQTTGISRQAAQTARTKSGDFDAMLSAAKERVLFSAHAQARMQERGIELSEESLRKLDTAVSDLGKKGARESLVYMDGTAVTDANGKAVTEKTTHEGTVTGVSISDGSPTIIAKGSDGSTYQVAISDVTRVGKGSANS